MRSLDHNEGSSPFGSITAESDRDSREAALDEIVSSAVAKSEAEVSEREDFEASKADRDTLRSRYGDNGKASAAIERFVSIHDSMKENPHRAADKLAAAYLQNYNLGDDAKRGKEPAKESSAIDEGIRKLDNVISHAIDGRSDRQRNRDEFAETASHRKVLKEAFPDLSFKDAMARVVHLDGKLWEDPIGASQRIAATYGAPVTPGQHAEAQMASTERAITSTGMSALAQLEAQGDLPNMDKLEPIMIGLLRSPDFPRTGDVLRDARAVHAEAQRIFIAQTIATEQAEQQRHDAIEKAKRAAPIKTSAGGFSSKGAAPTDIDSAISSAMARASL